MIEWLQLLKWLNDYNKYIKINITNKNVLRWTNKHTYTHIYI